MRFYYNKDSGRVEITNGTILTNGQENGIEIAAHNVDFVGNIILCAKLRAPNRFERILMKLRLLPKMLYVLTPDTDNHAAIYVEKDEEKS